MRDRCGVPPEPFPPGNPKEHQPQRDPVSVLTEVLGRDGGALSATETLANELSNADHLGILGSIWYDQVRRAQATRVQRSLRENLPAADADTAIGNHARASLCS